MKILKIDLGFARKPDGSLSWNLFQKDDACCGCTLYWFGPFCLGLIRDVDCAKGEIDVEE